MDYRGRDQSPGTERFVAQFGELIRDCTDQRASVSPRDTIAAIKKLLDLMRRIDGTAEEVVFFTDEAGLWQLGVKWSTLLPVYFRCLGEALSLNDYATRIEGFFRDFEVELRPDDTRYRELSVRFRPQQ